MEAVHNKDFQHGGIAWKPKPPGVFFPFLPLFPILALVLPVVVLFFSLIETLIMLVFNAIGRGSGTFKTLWASSVNIGVIYGISQIVGMAVVLLRGADSFASS